MGLRVLLLSALWAAFAAMTTWYCLEMGRQITYVTLADGRRQERRLPLLFRILLPLAPNLVPMFRGDFWSRLRENISRKLVAAGFEGLLHAEELLALHVLLPTILGPLWILFVKLAAAAADSRILEKTSGILMVAGLLWLASYPGLWLKRVLEARHKTIRRALPFTLDLLTLSVEAGMDFMTALQRIVERGKVDALGEELIRVIREIQIGKTRRAALRDMAQRVGLAELRSVVAALVQADELGVSIGAILRIQADQMRQRRFERAEKLANEAPVKMLGPLLFFIFPAVFLILLGPIIRRFVEQAL